MTSDDIDFSRFEHTELCADLPLPTVAQEIESHIGLTATLMLCFRHGGREAYFPGTSGPGCQWLVDCIGEKNAQTLCRELSANGIGLELPSAKSFFVGLVIRFLLAKGASKAVVSEITRMNYKHIQRHTRAMRASGFEFAHAHHCRPLVTVENLRTHST